jgi:SOS-response transcriptional repressor LexA
MSVKGYSIRIREIREVLNLKIAEFARKLNIPRSTLVGWEEGKTASIEILKPLEKVFNVNIDWLLTGNGEMFSFEREKKHPLIVNLEAMIDQRLERIEAQIAELKSNSKKNDFGDPDSDMYVSEPEPEYGEDQEDITFVEGIAAGRPIYQSEARSFISVPKRYIKTKPEDYYVGRIKGTSMTAAGIPDGVLVLIRISDTPRDGAIQIVECQGEATLKRVREIPGKGWKICFDDHTGRYIEIGPGDEFQIQGDFIAVLPEDK